MPGQPPTYPELWNRAWVYQRWVVVGRTHREIADDLGFSPRSVRYAVARFGLPPGKTGRPPKPRPAVLDSKRKLAALYAEFGSTTRVARYLHCEQTAVRDALDRLGIPRRPYIKYDDRAWFVDALNRGLTVRAMANELGSQRWSVYRALERHGLPRPAPYRGGNR